MRRKLPVVDVEAFLKGRKRPSKSLCAKWREIGEGLGFVCIVNHGFPAKLLQEMERQAERFHALPLEARLAIRVNRHPRGFIPARGGVPDDGKPPPTASEVLVLATEFGAGHPAVIAGRQFFGANQWPAKLPGFRPTARAYMAAMSRLGKSLLPLWAGALDLEPGFFRPYFRNEFTYFRATHYPPRRSGENPALGANSHVDASFMTLLPAPRVKGLEIQDASGTWFQPLVPEDAIIINTGQFLERWSNGRFPATRHRVLSPLRKHRYTLPCFVNPDFELRTECLPTCLGPDGRARHDPITYLEFFSQYMNRTYSHYGDQST